MGPGLSCPLSAHCVRSLASLVIRLQESPGPTRAHVLFAARQMCPQGRSVYRARGVGRGEGLVRSLRSRLGCTRFARDLRPRPPDAPGPYRPLSARFARSLASLVIRGDRVRGHLAGVEVASWRRGTSRSATPGGTPDCPSNASCSGALLAAIGYWLGVREGRRRLGRELWRLRWRVRRVRARVRLLRPRLCCRCLCVLRWRAVRRLRCLTE